MIKRFEEFKPGADDYDVCVVGAGAIGICLLEEFAESGKRILCAVGGAETVDDRWDRFNQCQTVRLPHEGVRTARPRIAGGATTLWGGQALPFQRFDFGHRPWVELPGWPIPFEEVDRYYGRARAYLGLPDHFPENVLADIRKTTASNISPDLEVLVSEWTARPNLFQVKRNSLQTAKNIDVVTDCQVVKLLPSGEGQRHNGAMLRSDSGASLVICAPVIILASGTVENARILLETQRVAPRVQLSPLLGRCFQDHVVCNFARLLPKNPRQISRSFGKRYCRGGKLMPKCHLPAKVQEQNRVLNAACHIIPEGGNLAELGRLRHERKWARLLKLVPALARYAVERVVFGHEYWWDRSFILELHAEQEPCLQSAVTLGNDVLQEGHHKPVLHWEVSSLTLQTIRVAGQYFMDLLTTAGVGSFENYFGQPPTESELRAAIRDVYHMMGTTRMGTSIASGVVDVNSEVLGLPGVYVAGASVFPTGSFSNPTLTAIALAIRLTQHLKQTLH